MLGSRGPWQHQTTGVITPAHPCCHFCTFMIVVGAKILPFLQCIARQSPATVSLGPTCAGLLGRPDLRTGCLTMQHACAGYAAGICGLHWRHCARGLSTPGLYLGVRLRLVHARSCTAGDSCQQCCSVAMHVREYVAWQMYLSNIQAHAGHVRPDSCSIKGAAQPCKSYAAPFVSSQLLDACAAGVLQDGLDFSYGSDAGLVCRYVVPLLVAATFAGALTKVMAVRQWSKWVTPASGVLLVSGGTYGLLSRVVNV